MANIQVIGNISTAFSCIADSGLCDGLTKDEVDMFHDYTLGTVWHGVGESVGYGKCDITGLSSELIELIADIPIRGNAIAS